MRQQQLLPAQLLYPALSAAAIEVLGKRPRLVEIRLQEPTERVEVLLRLQPLSQVLLIRVVFVRHVPREAPVGHLADGIHAVERNDGPARIATRLILRNE